MFATRFLVLCRRQEHLLRQILDDLPRAIPRGEICRFNCTVARELFEASNDQGILRFTSVNHPGLSFRHSIGTTDSLLGRHSHEFNLQVVFVKYQALHLVQDLLVVSAEVVVQAPGPGRPEIVGMQYQSELFETVHEFDIFDETLKRCQVIIHGDLITRDKAVV